MKTRRATNGKFISTGQGLDGGSNFEITPLEKDETPQLAPRQNYNLNARGNFATLQIPIPIPQGGWNFMKILILALLFSPWLYLIFRKHNREIMSQKVSDFFEDNFICKPCPPCFNESIANRTEEVPKKNGL